MAKSNLLWRENADAGSRIHHHIPISCDSHFLSLCFTIHTFPASAQNTLYFSNQHMIRAGGESVGYTWVISIQHIIRICDLSIRIVSKCGTEAYKYKALNSPGQNMCECIKSGFLSSLTAQITNTSHKHSLSTVLVYSTPISFSTESMQCCIQSHSVGVCGPLGRESNHRCSTASWD